MACFLVSAAEAAVTTAAAKSIEKKEAEHSRESVHADAVPFSRKVKWLRNMLWGGAVLLAFEHLWHGEIVPFFPFLTAANNPADTAEMLHEMATVGVAMAVLITVVWLCMLAVCAAFEKRERENRVTES